MQKRLPFILSLALLLVAKAFSQQPDFLFEHQYPDDWYYGVAHSLEMTSSNGETECYFVGVCDLSFIGFTNGKKAEPNQIPAKVIKLSPNGEPMGELTIGEDSLFSSICKIYHDPFNPKFCIAVGTIVNKELMYVQPFLAKFDTNLNLLWLRKIELPEEYHTGLSGARTIMDSQGDIVFCSWPLRVLPNGDIDLLSHLLYLRISTEGALLAIGESPQLSYSFYLSQGGLFEYGDGSGDYGQTFVAVDVFDDFVIPYPLLVRMDRDFFSFSWKDLPTSIQFSPTDAIHMNSDYSNAYTASLSDGSLLIGCRAVRSDGYNIDLYDEVIAAIKMDANDSIINVSFTPHNNDSVRVLASGMGMDHLDDETFFLCSGVYDYMAWHAGEFGANRFVVTKVDSNADVIWIRDYEDRRQVFQPWSVVATNDGGCLVTGRCWLPDHSEAKVFAIKFFADGTLSVPEAKDFVRPYCFYPNPAQDQLHLRFSPDVTPKKIELYDLQGRLVRTQRNGLETLEMGGLAAGTYTMRVTLEDGKVFSDKVVKE